MKHGISVVEMQMSGLLHAAGNSAMLHMTALAYPEVPLTFWGFATHIPALQEIMARYAPEVIERVTWRVLDGSPTASLWQRWRFHDRVLNELLTSGDRIMFVSISRLQLMQLQGKMKPRHRVAAMFHGELDELENAGRGERFPKNLYDLRRLLGRKQPAGLQYLLLSPAIFANLPERYKPAFQNACLLDLPYQFPPMKYRTYEQPVFGVFGQTGDGRRLEAVARRIHELDPNVKLLLNGFVEDQAAVERLKPFVDGVQAGPLPRDEYIARTGRMSHSLWLAPPDAYRLRASGAFTDAITLGKPVIFSAAAFPDYYHALEPGACVRCASVDDLPAAVVDAAHTHTAAKYAEQQEAVERLGRRFYAPSQAEHLRACLDWE